MHGIFFLIIALTLSFFPADASAGVQVYDDVSTAGNVITLRALTKGLFFPDGGKLVKFYVGKKHIGTQLSGGDGYAFIKYHAASPGIINVAAEAEGEKDEGVLLIAGKKDKLILIAIESALFESALSLTPEKGARETLQTLSDKFRIIYLTTLIGIGQSRQWLNDNKFPLSPVLKWEGAEMIDELKERGVSIYAIIGPAEILPEATGIGKRFSFDETEDGTEVKDWNDLLKLLK